MMTRDVDGFLLFVMEEQQDSGLKKLILTLRVACFCGDVETGGQVTWCV
jgi:hypothetical protein